MAAKVARTGVKRESGYLYFLDKKGDVSRVAMARGGGRQKKSRPTKVAKAGVRREDGYLYFEGRKDFIIKTGGLLVGPEEVEDIILQHPSVAEVAVIGIHDEKWGQVVTAVTSMKPGHIVTEDEVKEHCRKHLAAFQVPKSIIFTEKLPRDIAYGKIDRRALIRSYSESEH